MFIKPIPLLSRPSTIADAYDAAYKRINQRMGSMFVGPPAKPMSFDAHEAALAASVLTLNEQRRIRIPYEKKKQMVIDGFVARGVTLDRAEWVVEQKQVDVDHLYSIMYS